MTSTVITGEPRQSRSRLRSMIETWERDGLIRPEVAARALSSEPSRPDTRLQPHDALRRLEVIGYLGAVPMAVVGLLLATSRVGLEALLLIGLLVAVASPRSIRGSTRHAPNAPRRARAPRHRADRPAKEVEFRGRGALQVVLNGRFGERGQTTTLASMNRR